MTTKKLLLEVNALGYPPGLQGHLYILLSDKACEAFFGRLTWNNPLSVRHLLFLPAI